METPSAPSHARTLETIQNLFNTQNLSVLSTQKNGQPYASIVAVTVTPDLKQIIFLTPETTRKYDNLVASPRVAMLIHNSQNKAEDITQAISVTATGEAFPVTGQEKEQLLALYLSRHPHMKSFANNLTTAVIRMNVDTYIMVSQFQTVLEIKVNGYRPDDSH